MEHEPSRRARLDLMTPAELAITEAMAAVESAGCDVRLTKALILLAQARDSVADVVDGVFRDEPATRLSVVMGKRGARKWPIAAYRDDVQAYSHLSDAEECIKRKPPEHPSGRVYELIGHPSCGESARSVEIETVFVRDKAP